MSNPPVIWTEEMVARCFGMKRAEMTNKSIAVRLGVTERAVVKKCAHVAHKRLNGRGGRGGLNSRILAGSTTVEAPEDFNSLGIN